MVCSVVKVGQPLVRRLTQPLALPINADAPLGAALAPAGEAFVTYTDGNGIEQFLTVADIGGVEQRWTVYVG